MSTNDYVDLRNYWGIFSLIMNSGDFSVIKIILYIEKETI